MRLADTEKSMQISRDNQARCSVTRLSSTPKQRDSGRSRARILAAAQDCFATQGYTHAGMREIAAKAGLDVSMVARYFGNKENLFRAAFADLAFPADLPGRPAANLGRDIVGMFLSEDDHAIKPMLMLVRAAADPNVAGILRELAEQQMLEPLSAWLGGPDARARAAQILALCAGFFTYHVLVPLAPLSDALSPATRAWLERSIQDIVDGSRAL